IHFFGNFELAIDANEEEIAFYGLIFDVIRRLMQEQEEKFPGVRTGALDTFRDCLDLIGDLYHYHTHNRQIGHEASWTGESPTYYNLERARAAIHWDKTEDAKPYEMRAALLFTILERAFKLAAEQGLAADMFNFLSKSQGCLEARITRLNDWWIEKEA